MSASPAQDDDEDDDDQLKSLSCLEFCLEIGFWKHDFGNCLAGWFVNNNNDNIWDWVDKIFDLSLRSSSAHDKIFDLSLHSSSAHVVFSSMFSWMVVYNVHV